MNWNTFTTRQGQKLQVAISGQHRYTVRGGNLTVTMKYGDVSLYEGRMRAAANARSYAEEIAHKGGPIA